MSARLAVALSWMPGAQLLNIDIAETGAEGIVTISSVSTERNAEVKAWDGVGGRQGVGGGRQAGRCQGAGLLRGRLQVDCKP